MVQDGEGREYREENEVQRMKVALLLSWPAWPQATQQEQWSATQVLDWQDPVGPG